MGSLAVCVGIHRTNAELCHVLEMKCDIVNVLYYSWAFIFECASQFGRFVFTTDPRGLVRVWLLKRCLEAETSLEGQGSQTQPLLLATCQSPLKARIVCLDVCPLAEVF